MRRADDLLHAEERVFLGRFFLEHVERRARDMTAFDGGLEIGFDDEAATCAIDDADALLALGDVLGVQDIARLVGQGRVQRDEIGALQEVFKLDLLDTHVLRALRREEGVEGDDLHAEPKAAIGDDGTDIAAADERRAPCR